MPKSKSEKSQRPAAEGGKKSVPINHVILKRVTDLKTMVGDLAEHQNAESETDRQLTSEVYRQTAEITAIREQLQQFQETVLTELCDALDQRLAGQPACAEPIAATIRTETPQPEVPPSTFPDREPLQTDRSKAEGTDEENTGLGENTWASIRSAFLEGHSIDQADDPASAHRVASTEECSSGKSAPAEAVEDENQESDPVDADDDLLEIQDYEVVADLASLDEGQLRVTVENQERVISVLLRKLQVRQNRRPTMTQEQLAAVQELAEEELATEIRDTLSILRDLQRQGELELSLERARLSRRRTDLDQLAERIEGRARTLGVTINEDGTIDDVKAADRGTGSKSRRWLGAMGFGNS